MRNILIKINLLLSAILIAGNASAAALEFIAIPVSGVLRDSSSTAIASSAITGTPTAVLREGTNNITGCTTSSGWTMHATNGAFSVRVNCTPTALNNVAGAAGVLNVLITAVINSTTQTFTVAVYPVPSSFISSFALTSGTAAVATRALSIDGTLGLNLSGLGANGNFLINSSGTLGVTASPSFASTTITNASITNGTTAFATQGTSTINTVNITNGTLTNASMTNATTAFATQGTATITFATISSANIALGSFGAATIFGAGGTTAITPSAITGTGALGLASTNGNITLSPNVTNGTVNINTGGGRISVGPLAVAGTGTTGFSSIRFYLGSPSSNVSIATNATQLVTIADATAGNIAANATVFCSRAGTAPAINAQFQAFIPAASSVQLSFYSSNVAASPGTTLVKCVVFNQ